MTLETYAEANLAVKPRLRLRRSMVQRGRPPRIPFDQRPAWVRRLIEARDARGWSQQELAEEAGVAQTTIAGYESGSAEPDITMLAKLAKSLGVDPGFIAFGNPDQQDAPLGAIIERHQKDEAFVLTFLKTAAMLGNEGINADLHATIRTTLHLLETVNSSPNVLSLRERVDSAVTAERLHLREVLKAALHKN